MEFWNLQRFDKIIKFKFDRKLISTFIKNIEKTYFVHFLFPVIFIKKIGEQAV